MSCKADNVYSLHISLHSDVRVYNIAGTLARDFKWTSGWNPDNAAGHDHFIKSGGSSKQLGHL